EEVGLNKVKLKHLTLHWPHLHNQQRGAQAIWRDAQALQRDAGPLPRIARRGAPNPVRSPTSLS
ncbi:hypothetical protein HAX54_052624, partial [Datura stramonium]|nr:hypothetical protein [Datura stramonium]